MAITGARRLTVVQQVSRNADFRGRPLAVEINGRRGFESRAVEIIKNLRELLAAKDVEVRFYTPLGLELNAASLVGKTAEQIDAMAAGVDRLSQAATARSHETEILEMIDITDKLSIMKGEVSVGLFKQVMEGHEITGHGAEELQAILADPARESDTLTYVSLLDAREFANRLSNLTGRKFRVLTEEELFFADRSQLSGDYWMWTETKNDKSTYVLRHLFDVVTLRIYNSPERRCNNYAIRLVEDK